MDMYYYAQHYGQMRKNDQMSILPPFIYVWGGESKIPKTQKLLIWFPQNKLYSIIKILNLN